MSKEKTFNPRSARTPGEAEQKYVIAHGAPPHYVDGYGRVGPGAIVSLAPGVSPGRWMVEVSPEDAAKASADESDAQRLAVLAAAKIKANGNSGDRTRKEQADHSANMAKALADQEAAQREADAIAKAAKAADEAKQATDALGAEKQRADVLQSQLEASQHELAAVQVQLQKFTEAEAAKGEVKADAKSK